MRDKKKDPALPAPNKIEVTTAPITTSRQAIGTSGTNLKIRRKEHGDCYRRDDKIQHFPADGRASGNESVKEPSDNPSTALRTRESSRRSREPIP